MPESSYALQAPKHSLTIQVPRRELSCAHKSLFKMTGMLCCPQSNASMVPGPAQHDVIRSWSSGKNVLTVLTASQQGQQLYCALFRSNAVFRGHTAVKQLQNFFKQLDLHTLD